MSHFLYLKIGPKLIVLYTRLCQKGMYNFMKETPVSIDLCCFIIDKSWRVCDPVMQLVINSQARF